MRDKPIHILDRDLVKIDRFLDRFDKVPYCHPKAGICFNHIEEMKPLIHTFMGDGCGFGSTPRQQEILTIGTIRMYMGRKNLMTVLPFSQNGRTRPITPENTGTPVLPVDGPCHYFRGHYKYVSTIPCMEILCGHVEAENEAGAGSRDIEGNGLGSS